MISTPPSYPSYFLKPGEIFFSQEPYLVSTLLGSCVAVTMVCRRFGIGAICHALLPTCKVKEQCFCPERFRFMDCAIHGMIEELTHRGVPLGTIEAKIFGGADMFMGRELEDCGNGVGKLNVVKAMEVVVRENIRVIATDVGGAQGRKLFFLTHTGEVYLKRLNRRSTERPDRVRGGA